MKYKAKLIYLWIVDSKILQSHLFLPAFALNPNLLMSNYKCKVWHTVCGFNEESLMMTIKLTMKGLFKLKVRTPNRVCKAHAWVLDFQWSKQWYAWAKAQVRDERIDISNIRDKNCCIWRWLIQNQINSCAQLTQEFFKRTFQACQCLSFKAQIGNSCHFKFAKVKGLVASDRIRVFGIFILWIFWQKSYEDSDDIALCYGVISKECICHQNISKYVLKSDHMKKFFITFKLQIWHIVECCRYFQRAYKLGTYQLFFNFFLKTMSGF